MKPGFHLGAAVDIGFGDLIGLQTGLMFSQKGSKVEEDDWKTSQSFSYLEIPAHLAIKIKSFQIYAGPYLSIGIAGKGKWEDATESGDYKLKPSGKVKLADFQDDDTPYNRLDLGLNFGVGYKIGPVLINAGYSLGLGNLTPNYDEEGYNRDDAKISNRVIVISASFFFGK